jgi:hypothetical protein
LAWAGLAAPEEVANRSSWDPLQKSSQAFFHIRGQIIHLLRAFSLSPSALAPLFLYLSVHLVQRLPQHIL